MHKKEDQIYNDTNTLSTPQHTSGSYLLEAPKVTLEQPLLLANDLRQVLQQGGEVQIQEDGPRQRVENNKVHGCVENASLTIAADHLHKHDTPSGVVKPASPPFMQRHEPGCSRR
jgi:hypothetical protein